MQASQSPVFALSLDLLLAIDSPPVLPAPVHVGARISWIVQHARRRPMPSAAGRRPVADAESGRENKALVPKHLHRLACRAYARERFEEVGDRFPDLCVRVEHDIARLVVDEARGQGTTILAAPHFVEDSATQPGFENVKLGFAHGSL